MANRYIRAAGGNYNAAGTWESTPGGGETVAVPTTSDAVIGTALSGQLTINATAVAGSVDLSLYVSTITHNAFNWTVSGNVTFGALMTYTTVDNSGCVLVINNTGTLTTAGALIHSFAANASSATVTLGDNISFDATKNCVLAIGASSGFNMNGKSINGNSATNRVLVRPGSSVALGTARTITNATTSFTNADFRDITFSSASSLDLSAITGLSGDCGGNTITGGGSTLTFTTPATQTATGSSANYSTATWSGRVPLPQDDVVLSLTAGQTLTNDMPRLGKNISFGTATLFTLGNSVSSYGSVSFTGAGTYTGGSSTWTFESGERTGTLNLTSNGKLSTNPLTFSAFGATVQALDAISTNQAITINAGTLDSNNFSVSANNYVNTATITMGSSTWTAVGASGTPWNVSGTVNANSSTISFTNAGASSKTFAGGNKTYNNFTVTGGGAGAIIFTGSNTFNTLTVNSPKTITLTSGTTQTITDFVRPSDTGVITLNTSAAGAATLTKTGGWANLDYLSITNINVTPSTGSWFYGGHSTYVSGTGWRAGNSADMFRSLY